jgi:hypothetical protein
LPVGRSERAEVRHFTPCEEFSMIVQYACPVHKNVVLFTEEAEILRFILVERPETCQKCKKSYYKSECQKL